MMAGDVVTIQLLRNRVASLMEEMHYHLYRSGFSTIIRESRDYSCIITDAAGRMIVAPPIFVHGPVYFQVISRILRDYQETLQPGDVFICNHPYEGGLPHASDLAVVAPIFHDGELVAFSGSIAHKTDMGGATPGSVSGQATEIFQEGLLLPPIKLYAGGEANEAVAKILESNSRTPDLLMGDLNGQVGVVRMGRDRLSALCREFGSGAIKKMMTEVLAGSKRQFLAAFSRLPSGIHEAEAFLDSDGVHRDKPIRYHVRATLERGRLLIDLTGCDPQSVGPMNLRPALTEACCFQAIIGVIDPSLRYSDGARELVEIVTRPGSIVDSLPPAPCSSYALACHKLTDVLLDALGNFNPSRRVAHAGGSGGALTLAWKDAAKRGGNQYEIFGSSYGAWAGGDGESAVTVHLTNIQNSPIEIIESEYPCRVELFDLLPDSGGAGRYRGGLSLRRRYRVLESVTAIYRGDRARFAPKGVDGGHDGAKSRLTLHPDSSRAEVLPPQSRIELMAGDMFEISAAAGGGFGDPALRDPSSLRDDHLDGYVTEQGLRLDYGREPSDQ